LSSARRAVTRGVRSGGTISRRFIITPSCCQP
jgi:hypothetical protein